jgi:hypothetical protein
MRSPSRPLRWLQSTRVVDFDVADDRLDGGGALHVAADRDGDVADLAADPDAELVWMVVPAIALVNVDAARLYTRKPSRIRDNRSERVAVIGVAVQRRGVEHELVALG